MYGRAPTVTFDTMVLHVEDDLNVYAPEYLCAEEACQLAHVHATNHQLVDGRSYNQKQTMRPWLTPTLFLASRRQKKTYSCGDTALAIFPLMFRDSNIAKNLSQHREELHLWAEKSFRWTLSSRIPRELQQQFSGRCAPQHTRVCSVPRLDALLR